MASMFSRSQAEPSFCVYFGFICFKRRATAAERLRQHATVIFGVEGRYD